MVFSIALMCRIAWAMALSIRRKVGGYLGGKMRTTCHCYVHEEGAVRWKFFEKIKWLLRASLAPYMYT